MTMKKDDYKIKLHQLIVSHDKLYKFGSSSENSIKLAFQLGRAYEVEKICEEFSSISEKIAEELYFTIEELYFTIKK